MNWRRIPKESTPHPTTGSVYSDWKPHLAIEGFHQCVYCTITEASFGGIRNYHVEHYKPKGLSQFAALANDFANLYYACAICNSFKSDDWPAEPVDDCSIDCFPDPSIKNYGELFSVDNKTGEINGQNITGIYILNKLYLNRPQLVINRKEILMEEKYQMLIEEIKKQKITLFDLVSQGNIQALELLKELDTALHSLELIFHSKNTSSPYTKEQTQRPPEKKK